MAIEFEQPVELSGPGGPVTVRTAKEAFEVLSATDWPVRGIEHEQAIDAALKVVDGHRSAVDARDALVRAAREAGNLADASSIRSRST
ncbi:DUF982 domain-containing protein [Aquibium sp. ELW1220]|uniref:DUF982 domain-containing protein n=1 Tax=Aquibium sp. ELW1220 TaxID=2976766 RepID=UPI0025B0576F|nr:DUF982 domain-containing protein [Aquibium sp. ELW1220]MDN2578512.1 DUF982 domain-containing protein [Aquibium sp. ELW1220]